MLRGTMENQDGVGQNGATIIKCPNCGFINAADQKLCTKCQAMLRLGVSPETNKLPPSPETFGIPKWGTTNIERKLYLHVRNSAEPIALPLDDGTYTIGRFDPITEERPAIDLAPYGAADKGVSRKHASLSYEGVTLRVTDLGSANSTYLNGYKLVPNQPRILRDGDELRFGHLVVTVQFGEKASY